MKKVLVIVGTRPEAIKLSPLIKALRAEDSFFSTLVVHTGQHQELVAEVFRFFDIQPDMQLEVMRAEPNLARLTADLLAGLAPVIERIRPDLVIVQGDTTSAFTGALAAFYAGCRIGHVEAGLRTFNRHYPFPEEINRTFISRLADFHFAPTAGAAKNLIAEGIPQEDVLTTGNTGIDALQLGMKHLEAVEKVREIKAIRRMIANKKLILVTVHRRENHGERLLEICRALAVLAKRPGTKFLVPVHPNPKVREVVWKNLGHLPSMMLVEPLPYPQFLWAMAHSTLILTDSGGIQEEAPGIGKPVLLLRDQTERPEAVENRLAKLVGTEQETIVEAVEQLLMADPEDRKVRNPFGDGKASERIVAFLKERLPEE